MLMLAQQFLYHTFYSLLYIELAMNIVHRSSSISDKNLLRIPFTTNYMVFPFCLCAAVHFYVVSQVIKKINNDISHMLCQAMCKYRRKQDTHLYKHNDYDFLMRLIQCALCIAQHGTVYSIQKLFIGPCHRSSSM